ncbi:MAG: peptidoglycan D,D-transpeptidase FtsI family protein, partial [Oscillospiraceae bacterium]
MKRSDYINKKITILCFSVSLMFVFLSFRVYFLSTSDYLKTMAENQNRISFIISNDRGNIYDRNYKKLVNNQKKYKGILDEDFKDPLKLYPFLTDKNYFIKNLPNKFPYMVDLDYGNFKIDGVNTFIYEDRYSTNQIMPHLIGYIDKDNNGVVGLEKAYNTFLTKDIYTSKVQYNVTGRKNVIKGSKKIINEQENKGIITTIDKDIQEIIEKIGNEKIEKGSILITDSKSNEIISSASFPAFDPNNVENYIKNEDGALINRVLTPYTVGSTFKLLIAAVALENNVSPKIRYNCTGSIEMYGQVYGCHNRRGHGVLNLNSALEQSCNPYFVNLIKFIKEDSLYSIAKIIGFGEQINLGKDMKAQGGVLPTVKELENKGEKSSFSFGQGKLMSTPLHINNLVHVIINDGYLIDPTFMLGEVYSTAGEIPSIKNTPRKIFSKETADFLKKSMGGVINVGTGKFAN